jgi:excisionase family DNA binding protein
MPSPLPRMGMEELLALPVAVDLPTAARALGITANRAYELVRNGTFPCPVKRYGREWRVSRASIFRELDLDPLMVSGHGNPVGDDIAPALAARALDSEPTAAVSESGYIDVGPDTLQLLAIPQVADLLGVSSKTVQRLVSSGELPSVRIGTRVRIAPEDLAAYIARLRGAPASGPADRNVER